MSDFVEVKTAELTGPALDYAVAMAFGNPVRVPVGDVVWSEWHGSYAPSINWAQGGPLIDACDVWLSDDEREHIASTCPHVNEFIKTGPTKLIAACRAIVYAKLGDVVKVPKEIIND